MAKFIIITSDMHKIAEFAIKVKFRKPGNVVEYLPVEFEVFRDGRYYKAMPLQSAETRILTDLPNELTFEMKNGKVCNCGRGTMEVVEDIVSKLIELNVPGIFEKKFARIDSKSSFHSVLCS